MTAHRLLDGGDNVGVSAAATDVAAHELADLFRRFRLALAISPAAEQIWPGVQYPHWKASWSMKACCSGCSAPLTRALRPS